MLRNALQTSATDHVPVLADEVRELLAVRPGETVVDATFGAGGHAAMLAAELQGSGKLIAIDRDPNAREYFDRFAKRTAVQARFLRGDFAVVLEQLAQNGVEADAVLLDLGVSSMQIDRPERGFSYAVDAPLDMRMDPSADVTAAGIVNEAAERDLATIFKRYGEERYARQIARAIVRRRKEQRYERTDGSRSIAISLPRPWRSPASNAECPPAPNVASTTVWPGRTARSSRTSPARTGMWSVSFGKTLGNMLRPPFDLGQLFAPCISVPDLQPVAHACDDDFPAQPRMLDQVRRQHHAALFVEVGLGRSGEEEALEPPGLLAERIQRGESRLDESIPIRTTEGVETAVEASRDDDTVRKCLPELGRKSETVFVIDGVLVCAEKHPGGRSLTYHFAPL